MRYILSVLAGYFLGALSCSIILSKAKYLMDIRRDGSGNAGATNMARVHGMGAGLLTLGGDMLKTALAGGIGWLLAGRPGLIAACAACLIGHCWPVYYRFKGGKGVSVAVMIALLLLENAFDPGSDLLRRLRPVPQGVPVLGDQCAVLHAGLPSVRQSPGRGTGSVHRHGGRRDLLPPEQYSSAAAPGGAALRPGEEEVTRL